MVDKEKGSKIVRRIFLVLTAFSALAEAWGIRLKGKMNSIQFPVVDEQRQLSQKDLKFILKCARVLVRLCTGRSEQRCFFRTYIIACVLRRGGENVDMNVGLVTFGKGVPAQGHCWLTREGIPFSEPSDPRQAYPYAMGTAFNGVHYWVGPMLGPLPLEGRPHQLSEGSIVSPCGAAG